MPVSIVFSSASAFMWATISGNPVSASVTTQVTRPLASNFGLSSPASSWAVWLTNRLHRAGGLVIRQDAAAKLRESKAGVGHEDIVKIHGDFQKGDVLHVYDEGGEELARGLTNFSSDETMVLARHADQDVEELLGYHARPEIINRDNMVMLEDNHLPWDAPTKSLKLVAS